MAVQYYSVRGPKGKNDLCLTAKKIPEVSYRALKAPGKKFVQSGCYFINNIPNFVKKGEISKCTKY
jgi:hypothetical protein